MACLFVLCNCVTTIQAEEVFTYLIIGASSLVVGFDIHQKFCVYYSGARTFGANNLYNEQHNPMESTPQRSSLKPQSTDQAAPHEDSASFGTVQGTIAI